VRPTPTDEEAAAIVAAITMASPQVVAVPSAVSDVDRPWRFSGRWWSRPLPLRRNRP
jgi:hypothetical protein